MAIERTVIRYKPKNINSKNTSPSYKGINIGLRFRQSDAYWSYVVYPGRLAVTRNLFVVAGSQWIPGWTEGQRVTSINLRDAGLLTAQSEWEFIPLADDGATPQPLSQDIGSMVMGFGTLYDELIYSGGVVEVGAYVGAQYFAIGSLDMGNAGDGFIGAYTVALDWSGLPADPEPPDDPAPSVGFWTSLHNAYEV